MNNVSASKANIKFAPAKFTLDINPSKFSAYFTSKLNSILETPADKTMSNIVSTFQSLLKGGESGNGSAGGTEALINGAMTKLIQAAINK
jgi:hypothetical protein